MGLKRFLNEHGLPLLVIVLIVLVGYYKVFLGGTFLTTENNLATSNYTYGTTANGWRPDKGMGLSFFFADVGMWHPWSPLVWWEMIMPSRATAYDSSIILLGILASFSQYFFIRKILPGANRWFAVCVAPLIVFCADQDGYHYLRISISYLVGMPVVLMVLYDYFKSPRFEHVLKMALVLWFVAFFGNLWSLFSLLSLGFFFTLLYRAYHKEAWAKTARNLISIYMPALLFVILLGFWEFYSLFYEKSTIGYMREKMMTLMPNIYLGLDMKATVEFLRGIFVMEWYPHNTEIVGLPTWPMVYQHYVNIIFPFVLLGYVFLRKKNLSFWEFTLKWLVFFYLIHTGLSRTNLIPGYGAIYSYLNELSSKVFTMYGVIYPLQVPLIAFFLWRVSEDNVQIPIARGNAMRKFFAVAIALPFIVMMLLSIVVVLAPGFLESFSTDLMNRYFPAAIKGISKSQAIDIVQYNLWCLKQILSVSSILYYASSAVIAGIFLRDHWLKRVAQLPKVFLAAVILINSILLSWSIFPMEKDQRLWQQEALRSVEFHPTDRFYYVSGRREDLKDKLELFHQKWSSEKSKLSAKLPVGLLEPPGLSISGLKSFAPKSEGQWVYQAFNGDGKNRLVHLRLYYGGPLHVSDLLDISAVKYYYSDKPLEDLPGQLEPYAQGNGLYIYKNTRAWDYYYLADRLIPFKSFEDIHDVIPSSAYVAPEDMFDLSSGNTSQSAVLKKFSPGWMVFDFNSSREALLVVADAWHPFWKAAAQGAAVPVLKVNGIFKGVHLKPGHYDVTMYFDCAPYKFGIYVSVVAWLVFAGLWLWILIGRGRHSLAE
jgi:hypothetical protein